MNYEYAVICDYHWFACVLYKRKYSGLLKFDK